MVEAGRRATLRALHARPVAPHESGWDAAPLFMFSERFTADCLAAAFLHGKWAEKLLCTRAFRLLGRRPRGLVGLVRRILAALPDREAVGLDKLTEFILHDCILHDADFGPLLRGLSPRSIRWPKAAMQPTPEIIRGWSLPAIASPAQLADWLGLTLPQFDWFADVRRLNSKASSQRLQHYTYHVIRKGEGRVRLLESPKARLKALQRQILRELLDRVPVHPAAHGFRRGRSVVSYAAPHAGKAMVLRLDLCDFFASVKAARVRALFRTLGYPRQVAHLLTGLCTTTTPDDAWPADVSPESWRTRRKHADPHLPQGAPTSPALANLCAYRLDLRLSALAAMAGVCYTRYADDLAFSGDHEFGRGAGRFAAAVVRIVLEDGFDVNWKKTRRMCAATRQRMAGVIVNVHPNVPRDEYDRLKAILHNCRRRGPQSQNRAGVADFRAHMLGRVAQVSAINPARGKKLRTIFDEIGWE